MIVFSRARCWRLAAAANKNLAQANKTFGGDCRLLASNGGAVHLVVRGIVKLRQTRCGLAPPLHVLDASRLFRF